MKWINVKDRLPEKGKWILINTSCEDKKHFGIYWGQFINDEWWNDYYWCNNSCNSKNKITQEDYFQVTHWMPLPEPPKDNDGSMEFAKN